MPWMVLCCCLLSLLVCLVFFCFLVSSSHATQPTRHARRQDGIDQCLKLNQSHCQTKIAVNWKKWIDVNQQDRMKLPKGHTATVTQNYFFFGPSHSVAWEGLLRPWIRLLLQSHTEKGFIILPIISVGAEMKLARRRHTKLSYYAYCYTLFLWSFAQLRDESMHIFVCMYRGEKHCFVNILHNRSLGGVF